MKMDKVAGSGNDNFYTPPMRSSLSWLMPPPTDSMVSF